MSHCLRKRRLTIDKETDSKADSSLLNVTTIPQLLPDKKKLKKSDVTILYEFPVSLSRMAFFAPETGLKAPGIPNRSFGKYRITYTSVQVTYGVSFYIEKRVVAFGNQVVFVRFRRCGSVFD